VRRNYRPSLYDSLHDRQCTTAVSELVKKVWVKGGCKKGKDYCKIYLASDALTLLDFLYRNADKIYSEFGLDLGYYFSTLHLIMDLILKISKEEIGLITDVYQRLFVERSMRGGYAFYWDLYLEIYPTGQSTGEKWMQFFRK